MTKNKRPVGLTILAVLNFVFASFGAIGLPLSAVWIIEMIESTAADIRVKAAYVLLSLFLNMIQTSLLALSGVCYLKQEKLGKRMGNAYATTVIAQSIFLAPTAFKTGFATWMIASLIYPVITLILLNTRFKNEFPNLESEVFASESLGAPR